MCSGTGNRDWGISTEGGYQKIFDYCGLGLADTIYSGSYEVISFKVLLGNVEFLRNRVYDDGICTLVIYNSESFHGTTRLWVAEENRARSTEGISEQQGSFLAWIRGLGSFWNASEVWMM